MPIEAVTKALYVMANLEKLEDIVRQGDKVWERLPSCVRESLVCGDCAEGGVDAHSGAKIAMALSQLQPSVRQELKRMIEEVRSYVAGQVDEGFFSMLDDDMVRVITEMVTFIQGVGSRSVRNLLHALESANAGDWSYIVVQAHGRESEVISRTTLSAETQLEFGFGK